MTTLNQDLLSLLRRGSRRLVRLDEQRQAARFSGELVTRMRQFSMRLEAVRTGDEFVAALLDGVRWLETELTRKPRVAVMGEFNSGKSSLCNVLVRRSVLQAGVLSNTRVATLMRHHTDADPQNVDEQPNVAERLSNALPILFHPSSVFSHGGMFVRSELLEHCELLDTPGISDPAYVNRFIVAYARAADIVVWCSRAGQCWKETERQCWEMMPPRLRRNSVLVLTGADRLHSPDDRRRIDDRLQRETSHLFAHRVFVSSPNAARSLDGEGNIVNPLLWRHSGAERLTEHVLGLVEENRRQRLATSQKWADRLARQLRSSPQTALKPSWWVAPLARWAQETALLVAVNRTERFDRQAILASFAASIERLVGAELSVTLTRHGRQSEIARLRELQAAANLQIGALAGAPSHAEVIRGAKRIVADVKFEVSMLMSRLDAEIGGMSQLLADIRGMLSDCALRETIVWPFTPAMDPKPSVT